MIFKKFSHQITKYKDLLDKDKIVVCLSGGSDSLGLLILMQEWVGKNFPVDSSAPRIIALSVDHKLREDSTIETHQIRDFCKNISIEHHILEWHHENITSAVQEKARKARYDLITKWCKENKCDVALTGHIFEDQLEQVLMSIAHGSGIYSYLIPEISKIQDIVFIRPILQFSKQELQEYLGASHISWWEDSSNAQSKYFRNKIRPIASMLLNISDVKRISTSFSNIERIISGLKSITNSIITECFKLEILGYGILNINIYKKYEEEYRLSILRSIFQQVGRQNRDIRLDSLKIIDMAIFEGYTKTFSGCKITHSKVGEVGYLYIVRQFHKNDSPENLLKDGIWDNRFIIKNLGSCIARKLHKSELERLIKESPSILEFGKNIPRNIKKSILFGLPGIFTLEKLVSIPHIYNCNLVDYTIEFDFELII